MRSHIFPCPARDLHEALSSLFFGAHLLSFIKKPSGVRPIAVRETLRRAAAKCLVGRYQHAAVKTLIPLQLGLRVHGARETIIHKDNEWMGSSVPAVRVLALLDTSNAFCILDRTAQLRAVADMSPHVPPDAGFCYGTATPTTCLAPVDALVVCGNPILMDICGPK